jgi:hypothetical protein
MLRSALHTIASLLLVQVTISQNIQYPTKSLDPIDSVSNRIDSLICHQEFSRITIVSSNKENSSKSTIQYYIDTKNLNVVKCIFDTTFEDFYKTKVSRVILYFYKGYEFNTQWIDTAKSNVVFSYGSGEFLKDSNYASVGKLEKGWTKQGLDYLMKRHIASAIMDMKFMQSRNFGN